MSHSNFFSRFVRSEGLVYIFLEQPFYGNYPTLDSHTTTLISQAIAYSSRPIEYETTVDEMFSGSLHVKSGWVGPVTEE